MVTVIREGRRSGESHGGGTETEARRRGGTEEREKERGGSVAQSNFYHMIEIIQIY